MFEGFYRIQTFWYNFRWDDYAGFLGARFSFLSVFVSIFGYLIIFNDAILQYSGFSTLTSDNRSTFFLNSDSRLRLVYFGLLLIGSSNLLYLFCRPSVMRNGTTMPDYLKFAKENFVLRDYIDIHSYIMTNGHATLYGNDHLEQWDNFTLAMGATYSGPSPIESDFSRALSTFGGLVRCLVIDHYTRHVKRNRFSLVFSLILSCCGYFLLALPSLDLFLRVVEVTLTSPKMLN